MFKSLFSINLNLNHRVVAGKVSYGKFDGQHYCMVAAISDDKVRLFGEIYFYLKTYFGPSAMQIRALHSPKSARLIQSLPS